MTVDEVKQVIATAQSVERECERMREEIETKRAELISVKSALGGGVRVLTADKPSMPEYVYFALEDLYKQYSEVLQRECELRREINDAISTLDPLEQEIARAWIAGRTEEQIGNTVGYSRPTISRYKRKILLKLSNLPKVDTP